MGAHDQERCILEGGRAQSNKELKLNEAGASDGASPLISCYSGPEELMRRATEEELAEFKREAFRNALRLYRDACLLLSAGRYPTAYGVGVLAYEELGKVHAIDRACDAMCLNPDSRDQIYDDFIAGEMLYDHLHKQRRAHADTLLMVEDLNSSRTQFVHGGGLEVAKQQAFYVEMVDGRSMTAARIGKGKTFGLLRDILKAIDMSGDIGFNGFHCDSTPQSEWQAAELLKQAQDAFAQCRDAAG
jgi:AbiV family abortive infection protein